MESFVVWWAENIGKFVSPLLSTFLVSLLPIVELRGGLILASLLKVPLWQAVLVAVFGNIVPVPFLLWGIESLLHWLVKHHMSRLAEFIERKGTGSVCRDSFTWNRSLDGGFDCRFIGYGS